MLELYHALVPPLMLYGIIIRGANLPFYLKRLKTFQNRAIKYSLDVITGMKQTRFLINLKYYKLMIYRNLKLRNLFIALFTTEI